MIDLIPVYAFYIVMNMWYAEMDKHLEHGSIQQGETCIDLSTGCHTQDEIAHWYDATGGVAPQ